MLSPHPRDLLIAPQALWCQPAGHLLYLIPDTEASKFRPSQSHPLPALSSMLPQGTTSFVIPTREFHLRWAPRLCNRAAPPNPASLFDPTNFAPALSFLARDHLPGAATPTFLPLQSPDREQKYLPAGAQPGSFPQKLNQKETKQRTKKQD